MQHEDEDVPARGKKRQREAYVKTCAGVASGACIAGVFNPWDRALYLSIAHGRPFLSRANFVNPYQGFHQSFVQRIVSSGLYFPLEDMFTDPCQKFSPAHPRLAVGLAGSFAGALNAVIMNPLAAVKYQTWGDIRGTQGGNFVVVASEMWRQGGLNPFVKGITSTLARDMTFGGVFAFLRYRFSKDRERDPWSRFVSDCTAGLAATTVSSPFNYVRNIKYATPPSDEPASGPTILKTLFGRAYKRHRRYGLSFALRYLQHCFRIGWGTLRVGVGMALGAQIYTGLLNMYYSSS
jgi:hypothetical protein